MVTSELVGEPLLVLAWGTVRAAAFPDRVAAAAEAGFHSIGMLVGDYLRLRDSGWSDRELQAVLQHFDVTLDDVEVLFGFFATPGPANVPERPGLVYADPVFEQAAFHLADEFGARRVQAVGTFDRTPPGPEVISAFADLCDRAAPHGLQVALEFMPYTNIPDVVTASKIVTAAGRTNGGLCVDTWHFFRGRSDFDELSAVDPATIFMIQMNDGPATPVDANRMADSVHNRWCPGEGDFELARFLSAVDQPGLAPVVSVEIFSDRLDRMTTHDAAQLAGSTTRSVLGLGSTPSADRLQPR